MFCYFKFNSFYFIIIGGGKIAYYLSKQLSTQGIKVKIIEKDKNRCQVLAEKLPYV